MKEIWEPYSDVSDLFPPDWLKLVSDIYWILSQFFASRVGSLRLIAIPICCRASARGGTANCCTLLQFVLLKSFELSEKHGWIQHIIYCYIEICIVCPAFFLMVKIGPVRSFRRSSRKAWPFCDWSLTNGHWQRWSWLSPPSFGKAGGAFTQFGVSASLLSCHLPLNCSFLLTALLPITTATILKTTKLGLLLKVKFGHIIVSSCCDYYYYHIIFIYHCCCCCWWWRWFAVSAMRWKHHERCEAFWRNPLIRQQKQQLPRHMLKCFRTIQNRWNRQQSGKPIFWWQWQKEIWA